MSNRTDDEARLVRMCHVIQRIYDLDVDEENGAKVAARHIARACRLDPEPLPRPSRSERYDLYEPCELGLPLNAADTVRYVVLRDKRRPKPVLSEDSRTRVLELLDANPQLDIRLDYTNRPGIEHVETTLATISDVSADTARLMAQSTCLYGLPVDAERAHLPMTAIRDRLVSITLYAPIERTIRVSAKIKAKGIKGGLARRTTVLWKLLDDLCPEGASHATPAALMTRLEAWGDARDIRIGDPDSSKSAMSYRHDWWENHKLDATEAMAYQLYTCLRSESTRYDVLRAIGVSLTNDDLARPERTLEEVAAIIGVDPHEIERSLDAEGLVYVPERDVRLSQRELEDAYRFHNYVRRPVKTGVRRTNDDPQAYMLITRDRGHIIAGLLTEDVRARAGIRRSDLERLLSYERVVRESRYDDIYAHADIVSDNRIQLVLGVRTYARYAHASSQNTPSTIRKTLDEISRSYMLVHNRLNMRTETHTTSMLLYDLNDHKGLHYNPENAVTRVVPIRHKRLNAWLDDPKSWTALWDDSLEQLVIAPSESIVRRVENLTMTDVDLGAPAHLAVVMPIRVHHRIMDDAEKPPMLMNDMTEGLKPVFRRSDL